MMWWEFSLQKCETCTIHQPWEIPRSWSVVEYWEVFPWLADSEYNEVVLQGLKSHAVTMFEVGKLLDESLEGFLSELEKVSNSTILYFSIYNMTQLLKRCVIQSQF